MINFGATRTETGRGRTQRRTLRCFVRYGVCAQPASSVRGGSRRITIMRFRQSDIRVINRRIVSHPVPGPVALSSSLLHHNPAARKA